MFTSALGVESAFFTVSKVFGLVEPAGLGWGDTKSSNDEEGEGSLGYHLNLFSLMIYKIKNLQIF